MAAGDQAAADLLEEDRLAQVAIPVLGIELGGVDQLAGDRGVEGDLARARGDLGEGLEHLLAQRLDEVGVGGDRGGHLAGADLLRLAAGEQLVEGLARARDDRRGGPVEGGELDLAVPGLDQGPEALAGGDHRGQPALAGEL